MASKDESLEVRPGSDDRTVIDANGTHRKVPASWDLLPPGDAGLTRKLKSLGPTWTVKEKKGRRTFSRGVWADAENIRRARKAVAETRSTDAYKQRLAKDRQRREAKQEVYVDDFRDAVLHFLAFHSRHHAKADVIADLVTAHATPVGSGTVARTQRIPVTKRAEAAVIAWMRHATTDYDDRAIKRVKGERRAVRRELAEASKRLLARYRRDDPVDATTCPLSRALRQHQSGLSGSTNQDAESRR